MNILNGSRGGGVTKKSTADKPLVSIVTPVFNCSRYLEETVKSVIGQTYDNIEYIVIDGGSTDGTLDTIIRYGASIDYWVSEPDTGMYDAVNKGLKVASGDILAYLNADDLYYPDTIETVVAYYREHPEAELIYGDCDFIGPQGQFLYRYRYPDFNWKYFILRSTSSIPQQASFWRKRVHEKIGYFDAMLRMCGDFDFYIKAGKCCRIEHVKRNLARFRVHNTSLTSRHRYVNDREVNMIHERYNVPCGAKPVFLKFWIELKIKLLNLPAMCRKVGFILRGSVRDDKESRNE